MRTVAGLLMVFGAGVWLILVGAPAWAWVGCLPALVLVELVDRFLSWRRRLPPLPTTRATPELDSPQGPYRAPAPAVVLPGPGRPSAPPVRRAEPRPRQRPRRPRSVSSAPLMVGASAVLLAGAVYAVRLARRKKDARPLPPARSHVPRVITTEADMAAWREELRRHPF